ncbi:MAG: 2-oxoglutarate dehydrogenase complex dihydrolipoyllysine-residue succinyltransferase [Alphaproteobacteria bacterium]|nr:2-oxoglutarate dehydrogenase complex dihydrolipoyllysine-residue succinyltransferase [Alphaproteobacteria bacterium]
MAGEIVVPSLGESVSEATIAKWFKKVGDAVAADEPIVELETDKVTMEVNAPAAGMLKEIKAKDGTTVEVGAILGLIEVGAAGAKSAPAAAPKAEALAAPAPAPASSASAPQSGPAARKLLDEAGLSASSISGTGKDGRVTKGDVLEAASAPKSAAAAPVAARGEERVKMSKLRQVIAKRLKDSQNTAAILTTFNEIDMGNVIAMRNEYKDLFEKKHGVKLGFMGFFVKAACAALKEIPAINATIEGDEIVYKNYCDVGVAVGTDQGLVVPVVRNADQMSIMEIEAEIARLAKKAREGTLSMGDMTGGTFTVSNGGVYGSLMGTPIINPPQSGILGMHKTEERPVAIKGQVVIRPMMYVALSYDHRIVDGKESVTFLVRVKEAIEDPRRLLLGL